MLPPLLKALPPNTTHLKKQKKRVKYKKVPNPFTVPKKVGNQPTSRGLHTMLQRDYTIHNLIMKVF